MLLRSSPPCSTNNNAVLESNKQQTHLAHIIGHSSPFNPRPINLLASLPDVVVLAQENVSKNLMGAFQKITSKGTLFDRFPQYVSKLTVLLTFSESKKRGSKKAFETPDILIKVKSGMVKSIDNG
jgi:hypothetical protein